MEKRDDDYHTPDPGALNVGLRKGKRIRGSGQKILSKILSSNLSKQLLLV